MTTQIQRNSLCAMLLLTGTSALCAGCGVQDAGSTGGTAVETTDAPPDTGVTETTSSVLQPQPTTESTMEPGTPPLVPQLRRVIAQSELSTFPTVDELLTKSGAVVVGTLLTRV